MGTVRYATERARQHARDYQREYKRRRRQEEAFRLEERERHVKKVEKEKVTQGRPAPRARLSAEEKRDVRLAEKQQRDDDRRARGMFTYSEAAAQLGVLYTTILQQVHKGKIAVVRDERGRPLISRGAIEAYRGMRETRRNHKQGCFERAVEQLAQERGIRDWLTRNEAAQLLSVHPLSVVQMEKIGKLRIERSHGRLLIARSEVERCLRENPPRRFEKKSQRVGGRLATDRQRVREERGDEDDLRLAGD